MNIGKSIRIERIMDRNTGHMVIVPLDHGISMGPIEGIENLKETVDNISRGGADAVLMHKGMVEAGHRGSGKDLGLIIHCNASTSVGPDPNDKVVVASVEEIVKMGADAVSIHINVGAQTESQMLRDFGRISTECSEWQIPLLAMMYPRGDGIDGFSPKYVVHAARIGAELGADIIKTNYTGDRVSFKKIVKSVPKPIVIAGGPKIDSDEKLLQMVRDAIDAGAAGTSIGRNIFQHRNIVGITRAIAKIVHENADVKTALEELSI